MTVLGTAKVRIETDNSGLDKGFADAETKTKSLGSTLNTALGTAIGFAGFQTGMAGVKGILNGVIGSAVSFDDSLRAVQSSTGATTAEMEAMRKASLDIGRDTPKSAKDAALAMGEMAKAGIPIPDILNGAAMAAVSMASATGIEVPQAAVLMASAMNTFGLAGSDATAVAEEFAKVANASAIDVSDMGLSLQAVGPVAAQAGLTMDDFGTAIGIMGNHALRGSDAGTSLKTMLLSLMAPSTAAKGVLAELGVSMFDATGATRPFRDVLGDLQKSLAGATDQEKAVALSTIFGTDAIRAANILLGEGVQGWDAFNGQVAAAPSLLDQMKIRMSGAGGTMEQFKGSLETLGISLGTILLPALTKVAQYGTDALNSLIKLMDDPTVKSGAAVLAEGIKVIADGLSTLASNAPVAAVAIGILMVALSPLIIAMAPAGLLVVGIMAVVAAIGLMSAPLDTLSPKLQEVRLKFDEFALGVLNAANTLPGWVQDTLGVKNGIDDARKSLEDEIIQIKGMQQAAVDGKASAEQLAAAQTQVAGTTQTAADRLRDLIAAHLDATGPMTQTDSDLRHLYDSYIAAGGSSKDLGFAVDGLTGAISQGDGATISADEAMKKLIEEHRTATQTAGETQGAAQQLGSVLQGELVGAAQSAGGAMSTMGSDGAAAMQEIAGSANNAISALHNVQYAAAAVGTTASASISTVQALGSTDPHNYAPVYTGRAAGGPIGAGEISWVGEYGPELYAPSRSGTILSHEDSMAAVAGGMGNGGVEVNMPNATIIANTQLDAERGMQRVGWGLMSALKADGVA